jgi:deazaflavin-dependent oxidoreductase (nitroreductase family)
VTRFLDRTARVAFQALNQVVGPLARAGALSPLPIGSGLVVLETTGRSSGLPRQVPLAATRLGDTVLVSTVRADSQWVRNLEADPSAGLWIRGRRRAATAAVRRGPLNVVRLQLDDPAPEPGPAAA